MRFLVDWINSTIPQYRQLFLNFPTTFMSLWCCRTSLSSPLFLTAAWNYSRYSLASPGLPLLTGARFGFTVQGRDALNCWHASVTSWASRTTFNNSSRVYFVDHIYILWLNLDAATTKYSNIMNWSIYTLTYAHTKYTIKLIFFKYIFEVWCTFAGFGAKRLISLRE